MSNVSDKKETKPTLIVLCKMCSGQGFVLIRNGEDTMDCPRCNGTGKERTK